MIMALPIVGKILAGFASSGIDALTSSAQRVGQAANAANLNAAADPADFTQALDKLDQAASKAKHAASVFADKL
jgi:hypothetical protein